MDTALNGFQTCNICCTCTHAYCDITIGTYVSCFLYSVCIMFVNLWLLFRTRMTASVRLKPKNMLQFFFLTPSFYRRQYPKYYLFKSPAALRFLGLYIHISQMKKHSQKSVKYFICFYYYYFGWGWHSVFKV